VKTAAENGLAEFMPPGTPAAAVCTMAGVAVENASALFDAATGKCTMSEALDKTGRASVAAVCHLATLKLRAVITMKVALIPVIGVPAAIIGNVLVSCIGTPKFVNETYAAVKKTAVAAYEGVKKVAKKVGNWLKNKVLG
jgi:hypothetical protein